jgi:hypothetical protein
MLVLTTDEQGNQTWARDKDAPIETLSEAMLLEDLRESDERRERYEVEKSKHEHRLAATQRAISREFAKRQEILTMLGRKQG